MNLEELITKATEKAADRCSETMQKHMKQLEELMDSKMTVKIDQLEQRLQKQMSELEEDLRAPIHGRPPEEVEPA